VGSSPIIYPKPPLHICRGGFTVFASVFASINNNYHLVKDTLMPNPPFREARLVNGDKPLSERWYIMWWAWDAQKECLARKRDYRINKEKTKGDRLAYAKKTHQNYQ
jgi:hypothetical protein